MQIRMKGNEPNSFLSICETHDQYILLFHPRYSRVKLQRRSQWSCYVGHDVDFSYIHDSTWES